MRSWLFIVAGVGLLGCDRSIPSGGGGSAGATTAGTGTSSTSSGVSDPNTCLAYADQAACEAAGCIYQAATLFPPVNGAPVCEGGTPTHVCTYYVNSAATSSDTWRRDTSEGRLVIVTGVVMPKTVAGFDLCKEVTGDVCSCFQ